MQSDQCSNSRMVILDLNGHFVIAVKAWNVEENIPMLSIFNTTGTNYLEDNSQMIVAAAFDACWHD